MDEGNSKIFIQNSIPGVSYDVAGQIQMIWEVVKAPLIVPLLNLGVYICLASPSCSSWKGFTWVVVIILVKLFWKKPEKRYTYEPIQDDVELGSSNSLRFLCKSQCSMKERFTKCPFGAACGLSWPADRLVIQVLDDSTDPAVKQMVEQECQRWASKGINITPEPDFLRRAIPFLVGNPEIALVQARWRFVNADECLLTRMQEMSLDYHFTVEQEVGSATHAFFGFNGGWKDRTTVEDMDLAVRASLRGWKFLYLGDLQAKSELPSTLRAFRFQQHRWSCGPANLFRKMVMEIVRNKKVKFWKKVYVIYSFFFVRKIIAHMVTFCFYCVVLPLTILVPEVHVPIWGAVYIPSIITILNSVGTPRSIHLLFYWILFENVMSLHRTKATFIGLLEAGRANEWVVTEKLGDSVNNNKNKTGDAGKNKTNVTKAIKKPRFKFGERLHLLELGFAAFLFFCGCYDFVHGKNNYFVYLFLQTLTFSIVGFGYVGTIV
ncbi:Nucleotide-diphospho-sugar transferase [Sesbania bispinosa]|nr:Nucleotide-diphospho-sugar transferase [Sesbania bispinosa]